MASSSSYFGYSNEDNPFADPNLKEQFVWYKKGEVEGDASDERSRKRQAAVIEEVERVKRRRAERAKERAEREAQMRLEIRGNEATDWEEKEKEFHARQARQRSLLRVIRRREKVADTLAKNQILLQAVQELLQRERDEETAPSGSGILGPQGTGGLGRDVAGIEMELRDPWTLIQRFKNDQPDELSSAVQQISEFHATEADEDCKLYWSWILALLADDSSSQGSSGVHKEVAEAVNQIVTAKSPRDLEAIAQHLRRDLQSGAPVDVEYHEKVIAMAETEALRKRVRTRHRSILKDHLSALEELMKIRGKQSNLKEEPAASERNRQTRNEHQNRDLPKSSTKAEEDSSETARKMFEVEAKKGMEEGEESLGVGALQPTQSMEREDWMDKFRPRKPRFFNKVRTGYDWNTYNKAHYNFENPPPKVVQGYKFNIFYPDLIDRTKTPSYTVEPADSPEFCILRFHGGPPYEDIAFKIVAKEWAVGRKTGFRSSFDRGILQLHFNFKRINYKS
eukprot:g3271.t1